MKIYLVLLLLIITGNAAFAQSDSGHLSQAVSTDHPAADTGKRKHIIICGPSRGRLLHNALIMIYRKDKLLYRGDTVVNSQKLLASIPPKIISDIEVLNGTNAIPKYGDIAKYGTIEIYIDKKKDKQAYRVFEANLKQARKALAK